MATTTIASAAQSTSTFVPYHEPPPGVTSNPDHPESLVKQTDITIGIALPMVTIFYFARVYARAVIKRSWIVEDWLTTVTWAGIVSYCVVMRFVMANHGGQHVWDITAEQAKDAAYWFNVASVLYGVFILFTKLSVLWLYRRVFSPMKWSPLDIIIVSLIVIMVGFYVSTTLVKILECIPRAKIFDKNIPGTCVNVSALLNASGLFNTITDYIILLLPIHSALRLKLNRTKKLLVIAVFTFGLCAPIFSTVGFVVRIRVSDSPDTTWNQPDILLWGCAELTSGFLVVCFPEMSFLLNRRSRKQLYPRRPTNSVLDGSSSAAAQSRSRSRKMGSHMGSHMGTHRDDLGYYELDDDLVYGVRVSPSASNSRLHEPAQGTVQVHHEITIQSNKKEEFVQVHGV
ncbi:hypothetical protein BGW36DRAFT_117415 [Talaromyces proteolyticus]|uniref:Rhodopsin domain-containing protein n=1 Tax=Talaromyces proteolyticus TaxID=1131652 RepID=A0AAD4PZC3_9EURO|nr:uncharacterized protein BGW36DRAFT_117415 [Talaromyces proteolyticus]KAH8702470.1 hypothetical protein BGW36DRAFT_117415 [Talaromyces proteolyticus]